jgi:hypothetical protein
MKDGGKGSRFRIVEANKIHSAYRDIELMPIGA